MVKKDKRIWLVILLVIILVATQPQQQQSVYVKAHSQACLDAGGHYMTVPVEGGQTGKCIFIGGICWDYAYYAKDCEQCPYACQ